MLFERLMLRTIFDAVCELAQLFSGKNMMDQMESFAELR